MKNLQVKYERFEPISTTNKLVWQKDGGRLRFSIVYTEDTILFKDIRAKVEKKKRNNSFNNNISIEIMY